MDGVIMVETKIDSREGALRIAQALVERRLAAAAQVSGPIASTYWWKGRIEHAEEWSCLAKTRRDLYDPLERAIRDLHPYETPAIVATPIVAGSQSYLEWIAAETAPPTSRGSGAPRDA